MHTRSITRPRTLWFVLLVLCGCNAKAAEHINLTLADLPNSGATMIGWQTGPWQGADWVSYPGNATLTIEHALGREPSNVLVYVSFNRDGQSSAMAAGDIGRIQSVTDSTVRVQNGTQQDFFLRLTVD